MITKTIFFEPAITHCEHNSSESGRTLEEVIRNIRHQPYEIVAIFDACGNKICEHTNHQEEYTAFAIPEQWASAASLMVHNHLVDGTFSPQDLVSNAMTNVCITILQLLSFQASHRLAGCNRRNSRRIRHHYAIITA